MGVGTALASPLARLPAPLARPARFLLETRLGRIFLALVALRGLVSLSILPEVVTLGGTRLGIGALANLGIWVCLILFAVLVFRASPKLLWRIRRKLIISYVLIGLVPTVLILSFFLLSAYLVFGQLSAYILMSSLDQIGSEAGHVADLALEDLLKAETEQKGPSSDAESRRLLQSRLSSLASRYPSVSAICFINYRSDHPRRIATEEIDSPPEQAEAVPAWGAEAGYRGLVRLGDADLVSGFSQPLPTSRDRFVVVNIPLDSALTRVERETGLEIEESLQALQGVELPPPEPGQPRSSSFPAAARTTPRQWIALLQARRWDTGEMDEDPRAVYVYFSYLSVYNRIDTSTSGIGLGRLLLTLLLILAALFLAIEVMAIFVGFLLARSITGSIHNLSMGTERIRNGDFDYKIQVGSRDQLGELAESFNLMTTSVQDLLRQSAEKERLEEELRIARRIQMSLLPKDVVSIPGLSIAALCLPAAEVGGDYYDFIPIGDKRLALLIADVSGKGTSAALYMAELKGLVLALAQIYDSPRTLLIEANRILADHLDSKSFVTMAYAVIDTCKRSMTYARAGHNPILQLSANGGGTRLLAPEGLGLALDRSGRFEKLLAEETVPLHQNDIFLFFTDGLSEAMNSRQDLFGESRLREVLERHRDLSVEALREKIIDEISAFAEGEHQHDDMTMVLVKVA